MGFLVKDIQVSQNIKSSLLNGACFVSMDITKLGNKNVKEFNFLSEDKTWYKVNDWTRLSQKKISGFLPHPIGLSSEDEMFLMGGYLHGLPLDTTIPEFDYTDSDNLMSDLLTHSLLSLVVGDLSSAYAMLQTWLFLSTTFDNKPVETTSVFLSEQKNIIEFTF